MSRRRGLGKGLDALLGGAAAGSAPASASKPPGKEQIAVDKLVAGKYQPRRSFPAAALNQLADSIRQHGIIQPLVVRPLPGGGYEIVAGERRCRAAKLAGLKTVPAVVRPLSDDEARVFALVENLQRADLNPIEQAQGLARLVEEAKITHAEAAGIVGLSRPAVSNLLRLLELAPAVRKLLAAAQLEMGHARALLALPKSQQEAAARQVIAGRLTVRQTEQLVRQLLAGKSGRKPAAGGKDADTQRLEKELSTRLHMRVGIEHRKNGSGRLTLHYGSLGSLDAVVSKLKK